MNILPFRTIGRHWLIVTHIYRLKPSTVMKKIPEITALFWVMKICATTLGETAGDLL